MAFAICQSRVSGELQTQNESACFDINKNLRSHSLKNKAITFLLSLSYIALFSIPLNASAQDLTNDLGICFVDSLNGKDRKELVKWMFFSLSAHPELESYSNISKENLVDAEKTFASLVTRLLTEDCSSEAKAARHSAPQALKKAFELIVKVPLKDLLADKDVRTTISKYSRHVDQNKIKEVFTEQK